MRASLLLLCALYLCATVADVPFKNLAGEPSEFGMYVLPTPQMNAQVQNSAAYYIHFEADSSTKLKATQNLYVDSAEQFTFSLFCPIENLLTVTLKDPSGNQIPLSQYATPTYFPIGSQSVNGTAYMLQNPLIGKYELTLKSAKLDKATYNRLLENEEADGYIIAFNEDSLQSHTYLATYKLFTGNQVGVVTGAFNESTSVEEIKAGKIPKRYNKVESAKMIVVFPNGTHVEEKMHDDGLHNDGAAGDGAYAAMITAEVSGQYVIQATVKGTAPNGAHFVRTTEQLLPVINRDVTLSDMAVGVMEASGNRMIINILANPGTILEQFRAYAEVWGKDASGNDVAICWIGGMTLAQQNSDGTISLPLELDLNWVSRVGAVEPFTLKNVIVQDPQTFIPFDTASLIVLKTVNLKAAMAALSGKLLTNVNAPITEEMRMGRRPDSFQIKATNVSAASAPVILVHGYCSDVNPFQAVASQFTNAKFFLNAKANLDNDAFAKAVASFAGTGAWSMIGHSQGGLVGLHMKHYYWTGLDMVSGGRLLQSVGSPYLGCGAAGSAADLGKIFGVGCGGTNDLTKDGAALWLASVSPQSRGLVYYWTTTYKLGNWFGDNCNLAMQLVLSWPNDGVAEEGYTTLNGGVNMGNKEQWCHSVGMKYTAQTQDAARNAEMNANAARASITSTL